MDDTPRVWKGVPPEVELVVCERWPGRGWHTDLSGLIVVKHNLPMGLVDLQPKLLKHVESTLKRVSVRPANASWCCLQAADAAFFVSILLPGVMVSLCVAAQLMRDCLLLQPGNECVLQAWLVNVCESRHAAKRMNHPSDW
jgi:hypothetical protein